MSSILPVLAGVPLFWLFRAAGRPVLSPVNLTLSVSTHCNSRCKTCNIWKKREDELNLDEWRRALGSLRRRPYWVTISGGEPFLYRKIVDFCDLVYQTCRPGILNIPTNAILEDIPEKVARIARACPTSRLVINISLDGVGEKHDAIRGVPGNFAKFERTLKGLLELRATTPNLSVGIHSVVSVFNISDLDQLLEYASKSGVDQYISEIAEERVELDTLGIPITPAAEDYAAAVEKLTARRAAVGANSIVNLSHALRSRYYHIALQALRQKRQAIPCYAGWASAQIYCDGTVWPCCVRADPLGSLRETGYDFQQIWNGEKARSVRRSIAARECYCPLANAAYSSMLYHPLELLKVLGGMASSALSRPQGDQPR